MDKASALQASECREQAAGSQPSASQVSLDVGWLAPRRVFAIARTLGGEGAPRLDRVKDPLSNLKRTAGASGWCTETEKIGRRNQQGTRKSRRPGLFSTNAPLHPRGVGERGRRRQGSLQREREALDTMAEELPSCCLKLLLGGIAWGGFGFRRFRDWIQAHLTCARLRRPKPPHEKYSRWDSNPQSPP